MALDVGAVDYMNSFFAYSIIWEWPLLLIIMIYYLPIIWKNIPANCENVFMLPLLQKVNFLKDYRGEKSEKVNLIKCILPVLISTLICPLIVIVLVPEFGVEFYRPTIIILMSIPLICLIYAVIKLMQIQWIIT